MASLAFTWRCAGIVAGKRELKVKSSGEVFKRILQVATLGSTAEIEVEASDFARIHEGEAIDAGGVFEFFNGKAQFVAKQFFAENGAKGTPAAAGSKS